LLRRVFAGAHVVGKQVIIQRMMGTVLNLTDAGWRRLDWAWVVFFLFCAALNEYVARSYSQETCQKSIRRRAPQLPPRVP
jgi:intracellular septation protein